MSERDLHEERMDAYQFGTTPTPITNDEELMARLNEAALELRRLGLTQEADNLLAVDDRIATLSAELAQLKAQVAERDEALQASRADLYRLGEVFSCYVDLHAQKQTREGEQKAKRNRQHSDTAFAAVRRIDAALRPKAEARHD